MDIINSFLFVFFNMSGERIFFILYLLLATLSEIQGEEYLLGGYATLGQPETIMKDGIKYTVQRFQDTHKNEFLLQSEIGEVFLYENNVLKQYWLENEKGKKSEEFIRYKNGRADFIQRFEYILQQTNRKQFVNHKKGLRMEIWSAQTGHLLYHGGYNERRMKEGWGIEYDEESGNVAVEGMWSKGVLKEVIRCFNGDTMTELKRNGEDSVDPTKRIPIYVGGFRYDEDNETFIREGKGCLIDEKTGIATRECEWKDGKIVSGVDLIDGWYTLFKFKETINKEEELDRLGLMKTDLVISDNSCNDVYQLNLNKYKWIQSIEIGNECFRSVQTFQADGLSRLKRLNIGNYSFTPAINDDDDDDCYERNDISISNCDHLETIKIGNRCFGIYKSLIINGLSRLNSLNIGNGSFSPADKYFCDEYYYLEWGKFKISNCDLLESITVGNRCFGYAISLQIDGLSSLKSVKIGGGSFSAEIDYNYERNYNYRNDVPRVFQIVNCDSLESIEIGNDCFNSVQKLQIDRLKRLKTLKIGNSSFNGVGAHYSINGSQVKDNDLQITNCESLELIEIGSFCFADYSEDFELKNLPQLQCIQIGYESFHRSSFVIRGIELISIV